MAKDEIRQSIDLSGEWRLAVQETPANPSTYGLASQSATLPSDSTLESRVKLPGSIQEQGFGTEVGLETAWIGGIQDRAWFDHPGYAPYREPGNIKIPYWLQPDRRFIGLAWYRRTVRIPDTWRDKAVTLRLERPHWESVAWLDAMPLGSNDSLSTAHEYELGRVEPGEHEITVRIDNRMVHNIGKNSHSIADHTQGNWNGIVGEVCVYATDPVRIASLHVTPSVRHKTAIVRVEIQNDRDRETAVALSLSVSGRLSGLPVTCPPVNASPGRSVTHVEYRFPDNASLWDEFNPAFGTMTVTLTGSGDGSTQYHDQSRTIVGLREVSSCGTQITINGRAVFLRGSLECCVFPLTGYPPTDSEPWRRLYGQAKAHGLNHIRFHSWCPPEAAFSVADELGVYLQVECSSWANQGAEVGSDRDYDAWLFREGERIVSSYGNHPSFIMMSYGNEPAGRIEEFLGNWVSYWKTHDGRRLYTSGAGWPAIEENDYHNTPKPRIQAWGDELRSRINAAPPETRTDYGDVIGATRTPIVSHEIGQWCAFPNLDEVSKYTGSLHARNFEIFRDFLANNDMAEQARDFLMASGKLQTECYKEEIESALRTVGMAGFQLLGLSDFPGQGTAPVGVLDAFWDPKGYVTAKQFREFCSETVPLLRMPKRYWTSSETFSADIDVAHFGERDVPVAELRWEIRSVTTVNRRDGGLAFEDQDELQTVAASGTSTLALRTGVLNHASRIEQSLVGLPTARRYQIVVSVISRASKLEALNRWDIWVFPDSLPESVPEGVHITHRFDDETRSLLSEGATVLLELPPQEIRTESKVGFSTVFWNTAWTHGQAPHTLGVLCDPQHPVFSEFPTRAFSDWLWWDPIHLSAAMVLDSLPKGTRPLIQPIDTWFRSHRLGLLFECRVGSGRLMVSGMDLSTSMETRPVARQLRHSILRYMESEHFRPSHQLTSDHINSIIARPS